jgi:hypothetical protein
LTDSVKITVPATFTYLYVTKWIDR